MEGSISLGIYQADGKLVRVLHREAEIDDFEAGQDSLNTTWDGKNDAGNDLRAGKYHARGFVVGSLGVEGVGFFFNDWVTEDQPVHIARINGLEIENGVPLLEVELPGKETASALCDSEGNIVTTGEARPPSRGCETTDLTNLTEPIACAPGRDGTRWVIDRLTKGSPETEVEQFSTSKEVLRRLSVPAADPQPRAIAASLDTDTIFLLEENANTQRLRGLTLLATKQEPEQSISDWKVDFEKSIVRHKDFTIANGEPVLSGGQMPPDKVAIKLQPNPLNKNAAATLEVAVGFDDAGSFLKTTDGLPLVSISDTAHLQRIVLTARPGNSVDVFQDDDAVVEQYRLSGLEEMMAFDCGEIELK